MAEIAKLFEILLDELRIRTDDLRSSAARLGLERLLAILQAGISVEDSSAGFVAWSGDQIDSAIAASRALVSAVLPNPVEPLEPLILAIIEKSMDLCIQYLEKSSFEGDDFSSQNRAVQFMNLSLQTGVSDCHDAHEISRPTSVIVECLSSIPVKSVSTELGSICYLHGYNCSKENTTASQRLLTTLSSEFSQPITISNSPPTSSSGLLTSATCHFALVHFKYAPRLLKICHSLLKPPTSSDKLEDSNLVPRLSFGLRTLRLLKSLITESPHDGGDTEILNSVASYVNSLAGVFKLSVDFGTSDGALFGDAVGCVLLQTMDELMLFVHVALYKGDVCRTIEACLVASIFEILSAKSWRQERNSPSLRAPLVCSPRVVQYLFKLVTDKKRWISQSEVAEIECGFSTDNTPSCCVRSQMVSLVKNRSYEECLGLVFPVSENWMDDLIHLLSYLHTLALKSVTLVEKSRTTGAKSTVVSDTESVVSHDDEALFGDLFAEASRPSGVSDTVDQPVTCTGNGNNSSAPCAPIQALADLITFLKTCIFSPYWCRMVYEDACVKVNPDHVNELLSILNCQNAVCAETNLDGSVIELCFDLLRTLVASRDLPLSLKQHLVDQVLRVEHGVFVYNHYTLALVAHILVSGDDLNGGGDKLRSGLFTQYMGFIVDKVNNCTGCLTELTDLSVVLPCTFHMEILIMAYHLSSPVEKKALADLAYSTLKKLAVTTSPATGLSIWALLVSRVFLLLKHMILYPVSCPPWFLSRFRSKLRDIKIKGDLMHDHFLSLASSVLGGIFGNTIKESMVCSSLLPQLIDVVPLASFYKDGSEDNLGNLVLNLNDLVETLSTILSFWKSRKAESPDHLIVERYLFLLVWSTLFALTPGMNCEQIGGLDWDNVDLSDSNTFLSFSLGIMGGDAVSEGNFSVFVLRALNRFNHEISLDLAGVNNWEFLRKNSWLSLLVSVLNISRYNNMGGELIKVLSSILETYLGLMQRAFFSIFEKSGSGSADLFPLLVLKHTAFDKSKHDLFLGKVGFDVTRLETVYSLLHKLDGISSKFEPVPNWLFHGFPDYPDSCNGALLSCILSIKDVVCAIDGFLKVMREKKEIDLDASVTCRVLNSVMAIKTDRIFNSLSSQCETVCSVLIGEQNKDLERYNILLTLKQLEGFLGRANSEEGTNCEVREMLITSLVDSIEDLRKDGYKSDVFKFYLGSDDGIPSKAVPLFGTYRADLLVLIDALDKCQPETVNLKVIGLFADILASGFCPSLKEKLRKKFLEMDARSLSNWLEARLLGDDNGASTGTIRESTVEFLMCLTLPLNEKWASEVQSRLGESVLVLLDSAFLQHDLKTAELYFNFCVKLLSCEPAGMKSLLENTLKLMDKMVEKESLLPGMKFLLSFLEAVIGQKISSTPTRSSLRKLSSKLSSSAMSSPSVLPSKPLPKTPDSLALASESVLEKQNDGTSSGEEDDDDGTSDGDVGSIDREEEEDSNSDRALAAKVCTFTSSGSNFMEQHWYFCYTCDLTVSKGCCSVCARVCHKGHRVVYSRSSRFFCDCGAGGVRGTSCQCLKPRKFTGTSRSGVVPIAGNSAGFQSLISYRDEDAELADSGSDLDDDVAGGESNDRLYKVSLPKEFQEELPDILERLGVESQIVRICDKLLPGVMCKRESNHLKDKRVFLGTEKRISYSNDSFMLKKAFKSGSMDLKIKSDYPNSRELKAHLSSGSLTKSLLSVSVRGKLAVGEGDKVAIFDVGQLIGQPTSAPVMADKTNVKPLSKNMVRFEIVHLMFNPLVENYVCVAGYEECQVLTVNSRGEVIDRLAIELALQGGAYLRRIEWVPGSQVQLMVASNMFVKIYDLSQDNISPVHYFTLENDTIVDATLVPASMGKLFLLVLSESGILYRFEVSMEGDVGSKTLTDVIQIGGKQTQSRGVSLYFSSTYRLLFLAYQDGTSLLGRLDPLSKTLTEVSYITEEEKNDPGKVKPAALHHWRELIGGTGIFCCQSGLKSNAALTVSLGMHDLSAQLMRHGAGSSMQAMVGVAAYRPLSNKDKTSCLILYEDGSMHIFAYTVISGENVVSGTTSEQKRKLGPSILGSKVYTGANLEFPLDFFEKTTCITGDVKLSSDTHKGGDSENIKQKLLSDDGFLEGPNSAGFKVTVSNPNPDMVMVGCRIHVGNTSSSHIPSEFTLFQRTIKTDEGLRSWYDVPFTTAESLLADEEFTLAVGPTFDKMSVPRIDNLEIYGRLKDDFGWKEKMEEVLNLEASVLNANMGAPGRRDLASGDASIQEQVLADALKILARVYTLCGSSQKEYSEAGDAEMEIGKLRCKDLLEMVFQSDYEPLLQLAACRVLQAVFPKRETYYQVKDTMRLLGVIKSFPMISSRIGGGGAASAWVLKEFIAQIQAVAKITLSRRSNMASFLQTHGSEVVDGLMEIFWGILNLERPDTQTINSIVVPCVDLIYSYAECLASIAEEEASTLAVAPAISLLKQLLFAPYEAVQTSSSLAISSRLLQVPFPKQTMLALMEDTSDTLKPHSAPSDASGEAGNPNIMIEEDPATSSVQYCCDGCSTVPILRRRWHCTVCPDFDLCETCYQVLGADRLPPPHSRDHPMTAISIDLESVSLGDALSLDELTEQPSRGPVRVTSDMPASAERSTSSIHVLETGDNVDLVAQRIVSISASKRAVNSLLLRGLIEEMKGWMEGVTGTRAVPVMQFFYRLSSAFGGPFMDGAKKERPSETLDLEGFVRWLLDEIDVNKPFPAKARSTFGEVAILVFMFFTLMFRNWHQPGGLGSDGSKSDSHDKISHVSLSSSTSSSPVGAEIEKDEFASQLAQACSYLRNQGFLNYLMDILQQLVHVFKSSPGIESGAGSGPGCGSLLTVRRELPAGNFSPFFSDSYAKAHSKDLFADYHKLLLENTFRLVYSMVRPEKHDKSGEKDAKLHKPAVPSAGTRDLKFEAYQDVLCSYISNPNTTFVRRYARRLFLHLCGSKTHYYSVRDAWQYSHEVKRLQKIVNKSGGFMNPVPYERSVKLIKCLSTLCEAAQSRPKNWQKYCLKHSDLLPFLTNNLFYFGEESVIQGLKLLNLALYTGKESNHMAPKPNTGTGSVEVSSASKSDSKKKRKGEEANEGSEKSCMDMEHALDMFSEKDGVLLRRFVETFLLQWSSASVRNEAKCVLYGMWYHANAQFKEFLLNSLLKKVRCLPMYGQNIVEYTDLMAWLLGKGASNATTTSTSTSSGKSQDKEKNIVANCLTSEVVTSIYETLHAQNELLANHPNSRIYNTLSSLVEFDGYYLESEPCVSCSCPDVPYSRMKLDTLKSETKYTDNRIIVKCTGCFMIQSVTMNVHDARKSKSVKILNLYYNNRPVSDLSELKNNWSLWKRARSCHLAANQTELKVEFPIPITACNLMIELDSFYENLQAFSMESLQCPRCSRSVTDKHGICSNCHENAYQCRQCRNINYENLDSFLCNECGYSKYGRFEFHFMAKPSFSFDNMENDEDMRKGLAAIEMESENAHRRYQQLLGFKKPLVKLVSSIGEHEMDSQQKDTVQQMMVSLPGPSCKVNRKIALLGVLYGEKCKAAFDSVSKSVQTLQGLRRVLMAYLNQKGSEEVGLLANPRSSNNCYGCATTFVTQCLELLQVLAKHPACKKQLISAGILPELFENNIHLGPRTTRVLARTVISSFSEGDSEAVLELNGLIKKKVTFCLEHHRSMDIASATREELLLLSETCALADEFWESRLRIAFQVLFSSIKVGAKHPAISENIILPCLKIVSQACTPPRSEPLEGSKDQEKGKSGKSESTSVTEKSSTGKVTQEIPLLSYSEWERGATYLDFVRRQYKVSHSVNKPGTGPTVQKSDYLALKYGLRWKRRTFKQSSKSELSKFALGSWVSELILSACSQTIRSEVCTLINLLFPSGSPRQYQLLNLLMSLLPATLNAGESAGEYFELFFSMVEQEDARLFMTVKGCLGTICGLITKEVSSVESQERSLGVDISQGFILHKLIELLNKFLEVPNIRARFMRDELLSEVLEAFLIIRGLVVQKTKLITDCTRLLKDLLDGLVLESTDNKRQFIRACVAGLQTHAKDQKRRTSLFILEQLCNMICPSKPEPVYYLILNKAHTQEEFIRGSMTKNPYLSTEIGPLMRDVKNKICHQLDLMGLVEDDYGMELLVAGNIISLDLSIPQVYELVWKKHHSGSHGAMSAVAAAGVAALTQRDSLPMTVTYRLQGLDGEATEPMIKELEEEREESQDPEVEFAIAGAVRECGGLEIILSMIQRLCDEDLRSNQEELGSVLNLLRYCCKIHENRRALLKLGALGLLLETARRAFSVDAMEPAEGILLIVESLTIEANESDISITQSVISSTEETTGAGEQSKKIVLMFLERLCHPLGTKRSNKQQRNDEMVARILPYLTYGEPAAMDVLIQHFEPYLTDWGRFDQVQKEHAENLKDEGLSEKALGQRSALENFVRVSESLNSSSCGDRLKDIILEKGITRAAVEYLRDSFGGPESKPESFKTRAEWAEGLKLPSVPLILSMLRGLCKGHLGTQTCIAELGVLPLLHALEGAVGENEIGVKAENLLDTLANKENNGDGFLAEKIDELRHATKDEMRRRALKKREVLLQGLGMRQEMGSDGGKRIVVSQPSIEGLDDVEEEADGLACMVCREGYTFRPNDILGVYSFSKRVNLGATGTTGATSRGDCVYTTVSHFNIIHFQCHQEAKRADAALKNPKKEWEGATLRNNETLCNCIFPLRGPAVPQVQFARCVDQYWENLSALGRADGSRLRLLTYDIVLMLARFATGASFSGDARGGGRESNSRFLPFMVQMATYLLDHGHSNSTQQRRTMAKSVSTYLSNSSAPSSSPSRSPPLAQAEETVQFMMVNSLLSNSYEEWVHHRPSFIQRGIYHAYMQRKQSSSTDLTDGSKLFTVVQPMLVYTGLIEQLQKFFKVNKKSQAKDEVGLERWEVVMRERMGNMGEMVGFSKEMLEWLEDMTTAVDLQEAFDVMGALEDVFSRGFTRCEDFVRAAVAGGVKT